MRTRQIETGQNQTERALPRLWLVSDARNDADLEAALRRLPRGSGLIFRHYHLAPPRREARLHQLKALCRRYGHAVILAGTARQARRLGTDGCYGAPTRIGPPVPGLLRLAAVHTLREVARARRARASLALLSPVFPTRSHPGARLLGPLRFRLIARRAAMPVLALGGMNPRNARRLGASGWAAIDGLTAKSGVIPEDS